MGAVHLSFQKRWRNRGSHTGKASLVLFPAPRVGHPHPATQHGDAEELGCRQLEDFPFGVPQEATLQLRRRHLRRRRGYRHVAARFDGRARLIQDDLDLFPSRQASALGSPNLSVLGLSRQNCGGLRECSLAFAFANSTNTFADSSTLRTRFTSSCLLTQVVRQVCKLATTPQMASLRICKRFCELTHKRSSHSFIELAHDFVNSQILFTRFFVNSSLQICACFLALV